MKNLKNLVSIRSDYSCDQIIEFLKNELQSKVKDLQIFEENGVKVFIAGINTKLFGVCPHPFFRTY